MARIDSRLDTILLAIIARLIDEVDDADEASCYLAIDEQEIAGSADNFVLVVSPMSGQFDDGALDGGGQLVATDYFDFSVTGYSTTMLDQTYQDTKALTDATLGLVQLHRDILQALTAHDLLNTDDENVLRDPILPRSYEFGRNGRGLCFVRQVFRLSFDWDLTA